MKLESRVTALVDQDFERLFIDELNWDRFSNRLAISLPAPGQFTQGWLTRDERWRRTSVRHIDYPFKGIARLGGQVVFVVTLPTERNIPDYLRRCSIGRHVSRLHYEPIVIYSCPFDNKQVWQFVASVAGEPEFFEHRLDSHADAVAFSEKLDFIEFELSERATGISSIDLSHRIRVALTYRRQKRVFDRSRQTAATFEEFGNGLPELAEIADEHRGLDREEEATLFELAREGSASAKLRLFKSHLYIPLKIGLRIYRQRELAGRVELSDLISHGIIGLLSAIRLYGPEHAPRFMTYASLWVQREIDRGVLVHLRPIAIPFYVETNLAPCLKKFDIESDKLTQELGRVPHALELKKWLGLNDHDWRAMALMTQVPESIELENSDCDRQAERYGLSESPFDSPRAFRRESQLLGTLLDSLKPRHREALLLRYGLHPSHYGHEHTLEEIACEMDVSRERARQMEVAAKKRLVTLIASAPASIMSTS